MRIKSALAALAVAAVVAQASPAAAGNAPVNYGHPASFFKVAAIVTMISAGSVVLAALCANAKENRPLALQEAYFAAALPFAWVVVNERLRPRRR
ncbi:MAG: hypothetical protein M5U07_04660 [Xanthobacteraceae bacterium]|nr:hypothetical protein [Xanthobacteraceae bacterium]PWB60841.1 MAG: hypothetical protein C3F17_13885 [Bradyrhizobiaceae bacterium]GIK80557.1 MAG: hypothetical protein BroJett024_16620 [Alphaproteobacteria bacterium]